MKTRHVPTFFVLCAIALAVTFAPARAGVPKTIDHGDTYFGSIVVPSSQEIKGNITVFGGDADVYGTVDGDINVYGGTVIKEDGSVINGHVTEYGNTWLSAMPWVPGSSSTIARENDKLMVRLAYSVIVVLAFLIFPVRVRAALDRVEHHPGLSAAVGVLALIAIIPVAVLLFFSFIGWPLIPVEIIAIFAGILIGQAALGLLVGRRVYELMRPHATPSPLGALILGLIIISAAEIVPIVGSLVTGLVCLVGLGAAILAFIRETAFMGPSAAPRPPISGPPMPTA
jgi:hypothetical protein